MSASRPRPLRTVQRYLLQGLAVIGPLGITVYVLVWLFRELDGVLGEHVATVVGRPLPGLGLALLIVLLILTGWVAQWAIGARLLARWDDLLGRVPVARRVYSASRRVVHALTRDERYAFREVVLFEFPTPGLWSVGFVTGPAARTVNERLGEVSVTVYLPTAPNPMSGFLIQLPRSKVRALEVTTEEAFTYVMSAGAVSVDRAADVLAESEAGAVR